MLGAILKSEAHEPPASVPLPPPASSLDALSEAEIEPRWLQEAAHRAAEMDQGLSRRIPSDEVPTFAAVYIQSFNGVYRPSQ